MAKTMNFTELTQDTDFLCETTSASYPIADKTRNINQAYHDVSRLIWESSDQWQYDDSNATSLPKSYATLVDGQQDYELPSTAQRIERVEVRNSGGDYEKVTAINETDIPIALDEFMGTSGMPVYYDLVGRSVVFYPTPSSASVTLASGIQLTVNRDVTEFATSATTGEPGFAKPFHRILSLATSIDFTNDPSVKDRLVAMKDRLEKGLKVFYSHRNQELPTKITPANKKLWRQYL